MNRLTVASIGVVDIISRPMSSSWTCVLVLDFSDVLTAWDIWLPSAVSFLIENYWL